MYALQVLSHTEPEEDRQISLILRGFHTDDCLSDIILDDSDIMAPSFSELLPS
jgi:hypothetical protein